MLDDAVLLAMQKSVLCWLATVDAFVQKGFKLKGRARLVKKSGRRFRSVFTTADENGCASAHPHS
ncbi:hypothetical protein FAZ69_20515 [Trinickia terrae]|uniref:Uncharacterized protein n=1 Tax=Trinickia terrae TaxID=2571161 RepID=A0A4U1I000_9BURK|nr:hypothetical protein [Trinickia terrae]TKC86246.1 hypothetical protein FAZ69_20515 [Trinickia terrae]